MVINPEIENAFIHENNFFLTSDTSRIAKFIAHYELYKIAQTNVAEGTIVECGVFKGISLIRFAQFRKMMSNEGQKIVGFDMFDNFPETNFEEDKYMRQQFINYAGAKSVSKEDLENILLKKGLAENITLIAGDICHTVPDYVSQYPNEKISLLNLDVDIYEPAVVILENLYPKVAVGGVVLLDDYNKFPGETKAVNDYFKDKKVNIQKLQYSNYPYFIIKEND